MKSSLKSTVQELTKLCRNSERGIDLRSHLIFLLIDLHTPRESVLFWSFTYRNCRRTHDGYRLQSTSPFTTNHKDRNRRFWSSHF